MERPRRSGQTTSVIDDTPQITLYSGSDLTSALDRSIAAIRRAPSVTPLPGPGAQYWQLRGVWRSLGRLLRRAALGDCYEVTATGRRDGNPEPVLVRYVGTMANYQYLMAAAFSTFELGERVKLKRHEVPAAVRRHDGESLLFVDIELPLFGFRGKALAVPPWVKQRAAMIEPWSDFIVSLPRDLRREISRCLRKYQYQGRINDAPAAYEDFYRRLYLPHAASRFGSDADVATKEQFAHYRSGTRLVELVHQGKVVAANVVRVSGHQMWGLWRGFSSEIDSLGLKKTAEIVDYFSLLYAACCGVKTVDFGRSRPSLNDGVLRYKAKWGIELGEPRLRKACMLIVPRNLSPATISVLAGTPWITRRGRALEGRILLDGPVVDEKRLSETAGRYRFPGLSGLCILAESGFAEDIDLAHWATRGVELRDLSRSPDPLRDYLAS